MRVVQLAKYKSKEVVALAKELLELAEAGKAHGLTFVVKLGPGDHLAGVAGDYRRNPAEALQATFMMERELADSGPFARRMD